MGSVCAAAGPAASMAMITRYLCIFASCEFFFRHPGDQRGNLAEVVEGDLGARFHALKDSLQATRRIDSHANDEGHEPPELYDAWRKTLGIRPEANGKGTRAGYSWRRPATT